MDTKLSIDKLTAEIIEACIDRDTHETVANDADILKSDMWAEHERFRNEILNSSRLRTEMVVIAAALTTDEFNPQDPQSTSKALEMFRSGSVTDWQIELVLSACREWFFYGWHARGALEDAGTLAHLIEGRNRRRQ